MTFLFIQAVEAATVFMVFVNEIPFMLIFYQSGSFNLHRESMSHVSSQSLTLPPLTNLDLTDLPGPLVFND